MLISDTEADIGEASLSLQASQLSNSVPHSYLVPSLDTRTLYWDRLPEVEAQISNLFGGEQNACPLQASQLPRERERN